MTIEKRVIEEVGSFGRQIGMLTDALIELAGKGKAGPEMERLRAMAKSVDEIKRQERDTLADQAKRSVGSLAKLDPRAAQQLIDELQEVVARSARERS